MGYRIVYDNASKKKPPIRKIATLLCAVAMAALLLWPAGRNGLREVILPGDADVTSQALQGLAEDLGGGESLGDAVTAFCKEIIANGQ